MVGKEEKEEMKKERKNKRKIKIVFSKPYTIFFFYNSYNKSQ